MVALKTIAWMLCAVIAIPLIPVALLIAVLGVPFLLLGCKGYEANGDSH